VGKAILIICKEMLSLFISGGLLKFCTFFIINNKKKFCLLKLNFGNGPHQEEHHIFLLFPQPTPSILTLNLYIKRNFNFENMISP
jgi:hypothetical protein